MTIPFGPEGDADRILRAAKLQDWDGLADLLAPELSVAASAGVLEGADHLPTVSEDAFRLANERAVDYAADRAAELVGRHRTGPEGSALTENAAMSITETTREGLRTIIAQGLAEGWSSEQVAQAIEGSEWFSADRAALIARTELAEAHSMGSLAIWEQAGVVEGKKNLLSDSHLGPDVCDECADVGVIPLRATFPSGRLGPPHHPRCECTLVPAVVGE